MAPWADLLYACDLTWWRTYFPKVATGFAGELWTTSEVARDEFDLRWIFGQDNCGLSPSLDYIHTGKNSGFQALSLAYIFGAARVTLLGFDFMTGPKGEKHWHGDHPKGLGNGGGSRYQQWCQGMTELARGLQAKGVEVLNASKRTALRCFPRVTLETALHEIRNLKRTGNPGGVPPLQHRALR